MVKMPRKKGIPALRHYVIHGKRRSTAMSFLFLLTLAACGGGGGGGSSDHKNPVTNAPAGSHLPPPTNMPEPGTTPEPVPGPTPEPAPDPVNSTMLMGQWSRLYDWPQVGVHLQLLPDGRVLSWAYRWDDHDDADTDKQVFAVDIPADSPPTSWTLIPNNTTNLACTGFALMPDGSMFLAGGETRRGGSADANIFDFRNDSWTKVASMNAPRWYPTTTTLANGEVLTIGGLMDFATLEINQMPQVWTTQGTWRNLSTAISDDGEYPRMHLAPNGKVFKSGIAVRSRYLDTRGTGSWSDVATLNYQAPRQYGSSVMFDNGKIIVIGGGDPPTNTAEVIDLNEASPSWRWADAMRYARRHLNATIMADGNILVTGGTSSQGFNDATRAVLPAEMWNPQTGKWTTMASMNVPRVYHSTALLLPDGRILASGGGDPAPIGGGDNLNAEIFSPPYLFAGPRPTITQAPATISYGTTFFVRTPDANDIVKATWIRLSSVTHAFNMNQRINHLSIAQTSDGLSIAAPSDPNLTPPGHYMLFLINSNGVPSVAKIMQIL